MCLVGHSRTVLDSSSQFPYLIFKQLHKNLLNVKSSDCIDFLSKLHTSRAYSKIGKHFCFKSWTITSSEASLPILTKTSFAAQSYARSFEFTPFSSYHILHNSAFFFSQPSQILGQSCGVNIFCKNHMFTYSSCALRTDRRTDGKANSIAQRLMLATTDLTPPDPLVKF